MAADGRLDAAALARVVQLAEFEPVARAVMDPGAFDYIAGGSWDEVTLAEATPAWRRHRLRPRVLVDVQHVDASTTAFGARIPAPIAVAPMAAHGLAHPEAEVATARAAASAGLPFTLSTMSSASIEAVAEATPDAVRWFQLYTQADPGRSREFVQRAAAAGYRAILLTVDLPVLGYRVRDRRNGFDLTVPLGNFTTTGPGPTHADHGRRAADPGLDGPVSVYSALSDSDRTLTWDDLATIRSWSSLPLVLKGIQTAEDARRAVDAGVDGIVVSNHGARQLDRVAPTAAVLPEVVDAVGASTEIWVDGGVRSGLDVATALALGARGVLVGRPMFWALAAGGEAGVARALAILREEFDVALALLGATSPGDLTRDHVARG